MSNMSRKNIETIGVWTLQRREFGNDEYDYVINVAGKPAVELYINFRQDFNTDRTVYTVEYAPKYSQMDLEEAAEFITQAQQALVVATRFQQVIDAADGHI